MQSNQIIFEDKAFKLLISEQRIIEIVNELALRINNDYFRKDPVFIVVLNGAMFFAVDLLRRVNFNVQIQTIHAKSYGNSMNSTGDVQIMYENLEIKNKDVLIIEDIVDTGITLNSIISTLITMNPASIECAAFLSKPSKRLVDVPVKYVGIEIPQDFVIGYGLDFAEFGRNLPAIYSLSSK
jgi:hypoxanthine phosphoribosyltransferase